MVGSLVGMEYSAFIKGRQSLDGPLIINVVVACCKKQKKKVMILKVDFEKVFYSMSWDFFIKIMQFMGFGLNWVSWVKACLISSKSSVLVNGSPIAKFSLEWGLRQGDPMSSFLFLLVMEALNVAMSDAV